MKFIISRILSFLFPFPWFFLSVFPLPPHCSMKLQSVHHPPICWMDRWSSTFIKKLLLLPWHGRRRENKTDTEFLIMFNNQTLHHLQDLLSSSSSTFSCLFFLLLLPLLAPLYIHECSICIILKSLREPITHFVFLLCIVFRERWQVWEFGKKKKNQEGRMFE